VSTCALISTSSPVATRGPRAQPRVPRSRRQGRARRAGKIQRQRRNPARPLWRQSLAQWAVIRASNARATTRRGTEPAPTGRTPAIPLARCRSRLRPTIFIQSLGALARSAFGLQVSAGARKNAECEATRHVRQTDNFGSEEAAESTHTVPCETRALSSRKVCRCEERQAGASNGGVVASGRVKREARTREARIRLPGRSGTDPYPGDRV
jgi:hypothetical protein